MSGDGNTVALGLKRLDTHGSSDNGHVVVFKYDSSSNAWISS